MTERDDEEVPAGVVAEVPDLPDRVEKGTSVPLVVSRGPAPRTVPADLAGLAQADVEALLSGLGLVPDVQQAFSDEVDAGLVVRTEPPPGTEVPRDSTVVVVVSRGPELVAVPDVGSADTLRGAVDALEAAGLAAGDVRGPAAGLPAGTSPAAGTQVRKGAEVDILLE